jgi:hypothetical protein
MKKIVIAALVATSFTPIAFVSPAFAAESDAANCGLNARQVAAGWTCEEEVETTNVSRTIGGGRNCQDATITTTTYTAYNPSGNFVEDKSVTSEPEESEWGSSYPIGDGCNYPSA